MRYITVWFPTVFYRDFHLQKKSIEFSDLDDDSKDCPYSCTLNFIGGNGEKGKHSIEIISKLTKEDGSIQEFTVILQNEDISRNGFAIYSCDDSPVPDNIKATFFSEDILGQPIYHKIKEFFHFHEADKDNDSALTAQIKTELEKINGDDNDFLINLLKEFETMFCASAETISSHNLNLQTIIEKYEDNDLLLTAIILETRKLNKFCEDALIKYTYCKTLLASIYNKSFKHDIILSDNPEEKEKQIDYRRKALNIRNAVRYIENIKYKNNNRQNYILSEILKNGEKAQQINLTLLKDGERSQRISLTLGVMGIFYALIFGHKDSIGRIKWLNFENWWLIVLLSISIIFVFLLFKNTRWFMRKKCLVKRFFSKVKR
jgi:hypothetical protein